MIVESPSSILKKTDADADNPEKTAHLLAALKAAVPFEVELSPMVVKQLQADKVAAAHQTRQPSRTYRISATKVGSCAISSRRETKRRSLSR